MSGPEHRDGSEPGREVRMHVSGSGSGGEPPHDTRPTRWSRRRAVVLVAVLAAGLGALFLTQRPAATTTGPPLAPAGPVAFAWEIPVGNTAEVFRDGDSLLVTDRSGSGGRVRRVEAATGAVAWSNASTPREVVAVVRGEQARFVERADLAGARASLVGRSWETGEPLWDLPIDGTFRGAAIPDGRLLVSGNGRCGFVRPTDGDFLVLEQATDCAARASDIVVHAADRTQLRDLDGRVLWEGPTTRIDPVAVDGRVVQAADHRVTAESDGVEQWSASFDRRIIDLQPWEDGIVVVSTIGGRTLVDQVGTHLATYDPRTGDPVVTGDDGYLVVNGIDRVVLRRLDGRPLAETERDRSARIVDVRATADGALALIDDEATGHVVLRLYAYPDLEVRWQADLGDLTTTAIASSSDDLVVIRARSAQPGARSALLGLRPTEPDT